ncbi:SDR family NAD(P)-dependent oxidoreductase [[Mycoplasma] testudinis]|uniref:SDR family NAD(P)-dependent oxidoreductase n=1 Tax=[Mycoplasma] testudinis TaxID=33924 RepID=UPI00047FF99E|nr:SDR family NAD(P)-dependent oxidoreductase [[Mycoplasma] testudinis]
MAYKNQKVVLVTGASVGIGKAICKIFLKNNYLVIGVARRISLMQDMAEKYHNRFFPVKGDVTKLTDLVKTINALPMALVDIDILINNAGLGIGLNPVYECNLIEWKKMIDVNINGLINLTQIVSKGMVKKRSGHIINIGSVAGTYAYPGGNVYGATKAFVKQFSMNLRADLAEYNIRVSNIEPGLVGETEFSKIRFKGNIQKANQVYEGKVCLKPVDIAAAVYFTAAVPARVNINTMEIMASSQTFGPIKTLKKDEMK